MDDIKVIGRAHWGNGYSSGWVLFAGVKEFREWSREIVRARPGATTEYAYCDYPLNATAVLRAARNTGARMEGKDDKTILE